MEPAKINWTKIESRFVTDELFEHISAPKWVDLSAPYDAGGTGEDDAWFCRPDCRHPKSAEDFLCGEWSATPPNTKPKCRRSMSDTEVLKTLTERDCNTMATANNCNEKLDTDTTSRSKSKIAGDGKNNVKSNNGGGVVLQPLAPLRSPKLTQKTAAVKKKFHEDAENRDPNIVIEQQQPLQQRAVLGVMSSKPRKEAFVPRPAAAAAKSNGEGNGRRAICEKEVEKDTPQKRRLRSTLSARNLFAGKDLLGQISGFYGEIKKWITVRRKEEPVAVADAGEDENVSKTKEGGAQRNDDGGTNHERRTAADEVVKLDAGEHQPRPTTYSAYQLGQQQDNVRSHPPSPQRFPSPLTRSKHCKTTLATPSPLKPLNKPVLAPAHERLILGDLVFNATPSPVGEKTCNLIPRAAAPNGKPLDMLWFMKPCSYLGR